MIVKSESVLDFSVEKTQEISLNDLRASRDERMVGGKPLHGITHIEVIDRIIELSQKAKLDAEIDKIYVSDGGVKTRPGIMISPELEAYLPKGNPGTIMFNRVLFRHIIKDGQDDESNTAIAMSFHQRGLEIAYGQNVKVCSNMTILGGEFIRSYGANKIPLNEMFQLTENWLNNHTAKRKRDLAIMNKMKETPMDYPRMAFLVGMLRLAATKRERLRGDMPPLNKSQISHLEYEYLQKFAKEPDSVANLWSVYNLATNIHHPGNDAKSTELPNVLECNAALGTFIADNILKKG